MGAIISDCGNYRYVLTREIEQPIRWNRPCLFVMLNPSTADAELDDPTIRRCVGFAKREGCTSLTVVNLFALRSTDPSNLLSHPDPVGPDNDAHIQEQVLKHANGLIVGAWGAHKSTWKLHQRAEYVVSMLGDAYCLGKTTSGSPKHPLYIKKDQILIKLESKQLPECNFCESICVPGLCDICNKYNKCIVDLADPYDIEINESEDPNCFSYCEYCYEDRKSQI